MVSRQETARALLTPGEVMQLPPSDELLLVAGSPPVRAKKLRYYEERVFTSRLLAAPTLVDGRFPDRPPSRSDDWAGLTRGVGARLGGAESEDETSGKSGGLEQARHPGDEPPTRLGAVDRDGMSDRQR